MKSDVGEGVRSSLPARLVELLEAEAEDENEFLDPDDERLDEGVSAVGHQLHDDDSEADTILSDPGEEAAVRAAAGLGEQSGDLIGRYELLEQGQSKGQVGRKKTRFRVTNPPTVVQEEA